MGNKVDMIGYASGMLTVVASAPSRNMGDNRHKAAYWVAKCSCGSIIEVQGAALRSGHTTSCGCLKNHPNSHNLTHGKSYRHGKINPEYRMWTRAKHRARRLNIPFDLDCDDVVIPERCPVFPEIVLSVGQRTSSNNSPTLDRLIPALGYVKGNVRVISLKANRLKNNATSAELRRIADWLDEQLMNGE